jgi:hypothetical protein
MRSRAGVRCAITICFGGLVALAACGGGTTTTTPRASLTPRAEQNDAAWLRVVGNHIVTSDGRPLHARGANLHDPRSCDGCTYLPLEIAETERRADALIDDWKATLIRFNLESYASPNYPKGNRRRDSQWKNILHDPAYFKAVQEIVRHMTAKGAYVLVSEWLDPTTTEMELPTAETNREWDLLARAFAGDPRVMYGLVNEPHDVPENDAAAFAALNAAAQTIRDAENAIGARHHVISVPGVDGYARNVAYFTDHPITAGGGENVVYEIHVYDAAADFQKLFVAPAAKIPILIGEFGPSTNPPMAFVDISTMMETAEKLEVPYIAWNFHANCPPNLLVDPTDAGGCGIGMPLVPSEWGMLI